MFEVLQVRHTVYSDYVEVLTVWRERFDEMQLGDDEEDIYKQYGVWFVKSWKRTSFMKKRL